MEQIRLLREEEFVESLDLGQYAFQYVLPPEQRELRRNQMKKEEDVWGYFVNDRLASQLRLLPLAIWLNGVRYEMGGIASVATWPEYRRQGQVGKLLRHMLKVMRDKGMTVSMLHPFSFAFYRKYGWELTVERKMCVMRRELLPKFPAPSGYVERLQDPAAAWELLNQIYEPFASQFNGMLERTENWWAKELSWRWSGSAAVYYNGDGRPSAYLLYEVKERQMKIKDWAAADLDALYGIWTFIANHDSMAERYEWTAAFDDPFTMLLAEPRIEQRIEPYFMARIVDVEPFLSRMRFLPAPTADAFTFQVTDEDAEWNNGIFRMEVDADGNVVSISKKSAVDPSDEASVIRCDIRVLTSMVFGFRRPLALWTFGKLNGTKEAVQRWEERLPRTTSHLADFF